MRAGIRSFCLASVLAVAFADDASALPDPAARCLEAAQQAATSAGVPQALLVSIALAESGRNISGKRVPWPWTVNSEGEGSWFDTKAAAIGHVRGLLRRNVKSIDVGCFQVNLRWHSNAFASLDDAFDPQANANYAARFLAKLIAAVGLKTAVGHYHSATPALSERYRHLVTQQQPDAESLLSEAVSAVLHHGPAATDPVARRLFLFARLPALAPFESLFGHRQPSSLLGPPDQ